MLTKAQIREILNTTAHKEAFKTALNIHRKIHNPNATHFRDCVECKSGYALLLIGGLKQYSASLNQNEASTP